MRTPGFMGMAAALTVMACGGGESQDTTPSHVTDARWASSDDLRITVNAYAQPKIFLTSGSADFKPVWSKTGSMLTFFRRLQGGSAFYLWKTRLCVINSDGTRFRELTDGRFADFNPTWTRDGTNRILFNRYAVRGSDSNDIYWIEPTGSIGNEVMLSNIEGRYEWVFSGLKDGRLFIDRVNFAATGPARVRSFLLTPNPGGVGTYEEITRPTIKFWHKLSVSPSETKVAYMLDNDDNMSSYEDVVLYYADFDVVTRTVSNPVAITVDDPRSVEEYPRWSADESLIIYDSNWSGRYQMYAYRLADRVTERISDGTSNSQFGNFEGLPK
jgi:Tol biopolymer transport system component